MSSSTAGPISLTRALATGAAAWLHAHDVGYYTGDAIPADAVWPIYINDWGRADEQLTVALPLLTSDRLTYDGSLQVLVRARDEAAAEQRAALAADALDDVAYANWQGLVVSHISLLSLARLGKDQNGRAMWTAKLHLHGRNK